MELELNKECGIEILQMIKIAISQKTLCATSAINLIIINTQSESFSLLNAYYVNCSEYFACINSVKPQFKEAMKPII